MALKMFGLCFLDAFYGYNIGVGKWLLRIFTIRSPWCGSLFFCFFFPDGNRMEQILIIQSYQTYPCYWKI